MPPTPAIEIRRLSHRLPSGGRLLTILDSIDLEIAAGESVAILGPSGSGKSTLLALMAGLDRPTAGEVLLDGVPIHDLSEDRLAELRRRQVGFVFQNFQLLAGHTARENILLPLELAGESEPGTRADELLAQVGLAERLDHRPAELSGGEKQRVAIARALIRDPLLLLCDEPTGNLDRDSAENIADLLLKLHKARQSILVVVTHSHALAERFPIRFDMAGRSIERTR